MKLSFRGVAQDRIQGLINVFRKNNLIYVERLEWSHLNKEPASRKGWSKLCKNKTRIMQLIIVRDGDLNSAKSAVLLTGAWNEIGRAVTDLRAGKEACANSLIFDAHRSINKKHKNTFDVSPVNGDGCLDYKQIFYESLRWKFHFSSS